MPWSTIRQRGKLKSATANKTTEYYNTRDTRQTGDPLNDPDDMERAFNARNTLQTLKSVADWFSSAPRFTGWSRAVQRRNDEDEEGWPEAPPRTWLLEKCWRLVGLLDPNKLSKPFAGDYRSSSASPSPPQP